MAELTVTTGVTGDMRHEARMTSSTWTLSTAPFWHLTVRFTKSLVLAQVADLEASRWLIGLPGEVSGGIGRHHPPTSFSILLVAA